MLWLYGLVCFVTFQQPKVLFSLVQLKLALLFSLVKDGFTVCDF